MKSLSKKKKTEENEEKVEQQRTVSDEAAKASVVQKDMLQRRMPGEALSAWKHRVGLTKTEPKKPKTIK